MAPRRRIEFERNLMSQITARPLVTPPRRRKPHTHLWVFLLPLAVVLGGAFALVGVVDGSALQIFAWGDADAVEEMAQGFVAAMQSGNVQSALDACAEGPRAADLLSQESNGIYLQPASLTAVPPLQTRQDSRLADLAHLYDDLQSQGLDWSQAQLAAVAGVSAEVLDPEQMAKPVQAFTGLVLLESQGTLYSIEVSARRVADAYFITKFWKWAPIEATLDGLDAFVDTCFDEFSAESAAANELSGIDQIYICMLP